MASDLLQLFNNFVTRTAEISSGFALSPTSFSVDLASACDGLKQGLIAPNMTVLDAIYYSNPANVSTLGTCDSSALVEVPLCRVQFVVDTSGSSRITAEAWLPTEWNGRFLALGNGGLGGCIDYSDLAYGTKLNFATIGSNNGHDGDTGKYFTNPEVLTDFTSRTIHTESVIGKQIVQHYYGQEQNKSYYLGCSTGGRQGTYAALHYPEDFDGILAGAPAANWANLLGWSGILSEAIGAPYGNASKSFISNDSWDVITAEILDQCDELDGVKDGVITEPDDCDFEPDVLLCSARQTENCLIEPQVAALHKIYAPLYGKYDDLLYPRFDPGAEGASNARALTFYGGPYAYLLDWMRYAIYNDTNWDYSTFNVDDIYFANKIDPGQISTFSGNMSAFKARGGKFLTYHGRRDDLIASGNSKRLYNLVSHTLNLPTLDSFYRLFLVPGLDHCYGGIGAVNIGQFETAYKSDDPKKNVLLALVDWVEKGIAPDTITGVSDDGKDERVHCRYPQKSVWNGKEYTCQT